MELTNVTHHGIAAATFAFMYALGGSTISFLGAVYPSWRLNMLAMAAVALLAIVIVSILIPESPIWLLRKDKEPQAEAAMRRIRGDEHFSDEFDLLKFARKKLIDQTETKLNKGNNWSVPLQTIVTDVVTRKRRIPRPPFSFAFLVVLYTATGWSGLTYITLNGPQLFQVCCYFNAKSNIVILYMIESS